MAFGIRHSHITRDAIDRRCGGARKPRRLANCNALATRALTRVPRFYFNVRGDKSFRDAEGVEFPDANVLWGGGNVSR